MINIDSKANAKPTTPQSETPSVRGQAHRPRDNRTERRTRPQRPYRRRWDGPPRFGYARREPSRLEILEGEVGYLHSLVEWLEDVALPTAEPGHADWPA